jgi:exodeoxyribonuclease VII small subunit
MTHLQEEYTMAENRTAQQQGNQPDLTQLSYEDARNQLVEVVQRLEAGGVGLEESLALWERGEALANHCESWLAGAKARLDAARGNQEAQGGQETQNGRAAQAAPEA